MSKFTDLLADPYALKYYLVEASPYDPTISAPAVVNLYYSSQGYVTGPSDTPANTYYEPRITDALNVSVSLVDQDRVRGRVSVDFGEIRLLAGDISRNSSTLDDLATYNWDGRAVTVKLGGEGFTLAEYGTIGVFVAEGVELTDDELIIRVRNGIAEIDVPIQENRFAGTGGVEGSTAVQNKLKPLCYGSVRNITPIYVGNHDLGDGSLPTFVVHDGSIIDVTDVYSNGNALTDSGGSAPTSGQYRVYASSGAFQLGGSTLDTIITCDVDGADDGASTPALLSSVADIVQEIVGNVSSLSFASGTVSALNTKNSATVGMWVPEGGNALSIISDLLNSIGAYIYVNRSGEVVLGRVEAPAASAVETFDESQILSIERRSVQTPSKAIRLKYQRNWTPVAFDQVAGAVTEAYRTFLVNQWREVIDVDATVATAHPLAVEEEYISYIDGSSDASTEAGRLQTLYGEDREVFVVEVKTQPFNLSLGDTVEIQTDVTSRFNLSAGGKYVIIGLEEVAAQDRVTMTLWG